MKYPELIERFSFVSINHASEMLGVSPSTIQKLINVGLLNSYPGNAEGSSICYVRKSDLEKLRRSWSFLLNLGELAGRLGVSEDVALDMVKAGLFSMSLARAHVFSEWKFGEIAIEKFISKLQDRTALFPVDDSALPFAPMTLTQASRKLAMVGLNAALIFKRVAEGKLPAYRYASRAFFCGEILFDPSDISECSRAVKVENGWLARAEVAKRLKIKDSTLARWVKTRLITPIAYRAGAQYFNRDEVEKFAVDHLTSQEAAEFLEVGELTVQRWAQQGRLDAVSGPEIDGCHAYRFKREYLARWKEERLTFGEAVQILGVSSSTLHRWIAEGKIAPREDMGGKQRWFTRRAVLELHIQVQQSLLLAQNV
jgi:excisionase family DNA binding protein